MNKKLGAKDPSFGVKNLCDKNELETNTSFSLPFFLLLSSCFPTFFSSLPRLLLDLRLLRKRFPTKNEQTARNKNKERGNVKNRMK